jgi:hypothetical protein
MLNFICVSSCTSLGVHCTHSLTTAHNIVHRTTMQSTTVNMPSRVLPSFMLYALLGRVACMQLVYVCSIVHVRVMSTTSLHVAHTSISMCACTIVVDPHDHVVHLHSRITSHN